MRLMTLALALALPSAAFAQDLDGDGFGVFAGDCDDADPLIYPGAYEACDGLDNDCDGVLDNGCGGGSPSDFDGDGIPDAYDSDADGDGAIGVLAGGFDCDDLDPTTYPGAPEACDGRDNNCNGVADEGCGGGYADVDGDGFIAAYYGGTDCNDLDASIFPGAYEACDGLDNDCDGVIDNGCGSGSDFDGDGIPDARDSDADGDGADGTSWGGTDCDDLDPTIRPGRPEICDGVDNDCDGIIDDNCPTDDDGDGYDSNVDCDDTDPSVHPGAAEVCDGDDEDCDGVIDEGCPNDDDRDGYTDDVDCDDLDPAIHPGATEACNGVDDDCDGTIDEGCGTTTPTTPPVETAGPEDTGDSSTGGGGCRGAGGTYALFLLPLGLLGRRRGTLSAR